MRLRLIIPVLLFTVCSVMHSQSLIGLTKEEVKVIVKKDYRRFRKDNSVVKQQFNYLKYVNVNKTRTWILYFTKEDICKTSKLICDYSEYDDVLDHLSTSYENVGESHWEYTKADDTFQVKLTKEEWYFTVRETSKE